MVREALRPDSSMFGESSRRNEDGKAGGRCSCCLARARTDDGGETLLRAYWPGRLAVLARMK